MQRWLCAFALVLVGCHHATELLVVLSTDVPADQYDALSLSVGDQGSTEQQFARTYLVPAEATLPASIELHPTQGAPIVELDVSLSKGGTTEVTRRAVVPFEKDRALYLRLELQAACVGVMCAADQTCIDGTCQSDAISPSTLTPIPSNPLAGLDGGGVLDLATAGDLAMADLNGPADLSGPADLQSIPDLASGCPILTSPPASAATCTVYQPTSAVFTTLIQSTGNATVSSTECPGLLTITMPAGTNALGTQNAFTLITPPNSAYTLPYNLTAGYSQQPVVGGQAGIVAFDSSNVYAGFYTTSPLAGSTDVYYDSGQSAAYFAPADGSNTLGLQATANATASANFQLTAGSNVTSKENSMVSPTANRVGFFVANDGSMNPNDTFTVYLGWIQICQP